MPYKIVFFDIDGTLLNQDHEIPADTKKSIERLREKGIKVAIATGRSPYHALPIAKQLDIDTYVSFNGSYVVCENQVVHENVLSNEILSSLEEIAGKHGHPLVHLSHDKFYANAENHPYVIESFEQLGMQLPGYRTGFWKERKIYQTLLYCQAHEEPFYEQLFDRVAHVRWHKYSMDIMPFNGSKARGIEVLLGHLGLSAEEAVAFGDGLNDREMLSYVGMGVAMGNAHEETKTAANLVTKHVNEGGIAFGLQQIGLLA